MLIIHNRGGAVLAVIGVCVGLICLWIESAISGRVSFSLGVAAAGVTWLFFGWRRRNRETGEKGPWPHVYFVPMPVYGCLVLILALVIWLLEPSMRAQDRDPRYRALRADEAILKAAETGGDTTLSRAVHKGVLAFRDKGTEVDGAHALARFKGDRTLVLVQIPKLKDFSAAQRGAVLDAIEQATRSAYPLGDDPLYIGVRGKLIYGAVQSPAGRDVSVAADKDKLLPFYDVAAPRATPNASTSPAG